VFLSIEVCLLTVTIPPFSLSLPSYTSRTGEHNMYKEYRDTTLNGAVEQVRERERERGGGHNNDRIDNTLFFYPSPPSPPPF
jgi:hypothetical protein